MNDESVLVHWRGAPIPLFRVAFVVRNHWPDLLAALIATDPSRSQKCSDLITTLRNCKKAVVGPDSRPDIVLISGDACVAVVKVKVPAGLAANQPEWVQSGTPRTQCN